MSWWKENKERYTRLKYAPFLTHLVGLASEDIGAAVADTNDSGGRTSPGGIPSAYHEAHKGEVHRCNITKQRAV